MVTAERNDCGSRFRTGSNVALAATSIRKAVPAFGPPRDHAGATV
jgi:hypothetical protein